MRHRCPEGVAQPACLRARRTRCPPELLAPSSPPVWLRERHCYPPSPRLVARCGRWSLTVSGSRLCRCSPSRSAGHGSRGNVEPDRPHRRTRRTPRSPPATPTRCPDHRRSPVRCPGLSPTRRPGRYTLKHSPGQPRFSTRRLGDPLDKNQKRRGEHYAPGYRTRRIQTKGMGLCPTGTHRVGVDGIEPPTAGV